MRKITLLLNVVTAVLFSAFVAYTFLADEHLKSLARDFVTEKTLHYSGPVMDTVQKALDAPLVAKLLSADDIQLIRREVELYQEDPGVWIADLTRLKVPLPRQQNAGGIAEKVAEAKRQVRTFYDKTLNALIADLRIFSGTNLAAAVLAIVLTTTARSSVRKPLVLFSFLLFVAVVFCSWLYIDSLSFFRILTSTHMGWSYPVFVAAVVGLLYKDAAAAKKTTD